MRPKQWECSPKGLLGHLQWVYDNMVRNNELCGVLPPSPLRIRVKYIGNQVLNSFSFFKVAPKMHRVQSLACPSGGFLYEIWATLYFLLQFNRIYILSIWHNPVLRRSSLGPRVQHNNGGQHNSVVSGGNENLIWCIGELFVISAFTALYSILMTQSGWHLIP